MAFIDNARQILGRGLDDMTAGMRITIYVGRGVHIEGYKKIITFGPENIELRAGKRAVSVEGNDLCICELGNEDIYITGKIYRVTTEGQGD